MALRNADFPVKTLEDIADKAFAIMIMGDDRAIEATYIMGEIAYQSV
jgi:guanine deaminase